MRFSLRTLVTFGAVAMALGNVGRIPMGALGGRTAPFVVADVATALVWFALAAVVLGGRVRVTLDEISLPVVAFVAVATISTVLGIDRYGMDFKDAVGTLAFLVRWVMYFGWYLLVVWCLTPDEARSAWRYIETALIVFAAFGILQSAFLPGFAQLVHNEPGLPVWDEQGHRLVSTLLDPNFAGLLIVIPLLFRLARIAEGIEERGSSWILTLLVAALVLTVSRSSALALVVGLAVIAVLRGVRSKLSYTVLVGAAFVVPALVLMRGYLASMNRLYIDTSALERIIPWTRSLALFLEHPVLGIGFNAARQAQMAHGWVPVGIADVSLDAGLLFVATMTGAIGLLFYLVMLWRVLRVSRRVCGDPDIPSADRAHGTATAACTVAMLVHSFFANSLLLPFVMQIFWVMWGTLMHIASDRRVRRGAIAALATVPLLVALGGCEPCAGTTVCGTVSRVDLAGQIVDAKSGVPVQGAIVRVTLSDGFNLSATTDANGDWEAARDDSGSVSLTATAVVTAPGHAGYTVPSFAVTPVLRTGDATLLGAWLSYPYVHYQAGLTHGGKALVSASVKFKPTSGVAVTGTFTGITNGVGVFALDLGGEQLGNVVGDLTVTDSSLGQPSVLSGYVIPLDYRYQIATPQAVFSVGGLLTYGGEVFFRGNGQPVKGVVVKWVRTGGIQTTPTTYSVASDSTGFFLLPIQSQGTGVVTGSLTLTPPGGPATTYPNIQMSTYDSTADRSLGVFGYGQQWAWAIAIWRNDSLKPAVGVPVTFRRTGGIAIQPDSIQATTAADGTIRIRANVTDTGFVDGEITVYPDSGPPRLISGLHLGTYAADAVPFAGVFSYGPSLHYAGKLVNSDTVPVVGATVTWTRDYGLNATPATLTVKTDSTGYFDLWLYPPDNAEGTVAGHLTVSPPAPYPANTQYVIDFVSLTTFLSAQRQFSYQFVIPKP